MGVSEQEIIHDRLVYYGESADMELLVVETIAQLPGEVAEFALDGCCFISVGVAIFGVVLPGRVGRPQVGWDRDLEPWQSNPSEKWIVVLAEDLPSTDAHGIVAHEIAHAWRGDDRLG